MTPADRKALANDLAQECECHLHVSGFLDHTSKSGRPAVIASYILRALDRMTPDSVAAAERAVAEAALRWSSDQCKPPSALPALPDYVAGYTALHDAVDRLRAIRENRPLCGATPIGGGFTYYAFKDNGDFTCSLDMNTARDTGSTIKCELPAGHYGDIAGPPVHECGAFRWREPVT